MRVKLIVCLVCASSCSVDRTGLGTARDGGAVDSGPVIDANVGPDALLDGDHADECPDDPTKDRPGVCGCGVPDDDQDADGAPDCIDACRTDPSKTEPGACGCGVPDMDSDGDGSFACNDCDDTNREVFPAQTESCNTIDDDCDGEVDEESCASGCSDGTREAFADEELHPTIAGCAGGWSVPGLLADVNCARVSGNTSTNPAGTGCSATDLCAAGWHICTLADVEECEDTGGFYAAAVGGSGIRDCTPTGSNDLVGCGGRSLGSPAIGPSCSPLTEWVPDYLCAARLHWSCPTPDNELTSVTSTGDVPNTGVLCCRD